MLLLSENMNKQQLEEELEKRKQEIQQFDEDYDKEKDKIKRMAQEYENSKKYYPNQRYSVLKTVIRMTTLSYDEYLNEK